MTTMERHTRPTLATVARIGGVTGFSLPFAYALVFALYAVVRSLPVISTQTPPEIGVWATLAANGVSILLASLSMAALLSAASALVGAGTALMIAWACALWNRARDGRRAVLIGVAVSAALVLIYQVSINAALSGAGRTLPSLGAETYSFWFGLPGLVYICAAAIGAWRLNSAWANAPRAEKLASVNLRSSVERSHKVNTSSPLPAQGRRILLVILDAFLALTAMAGGIALLSGSISPPLEMLEGSPFRSFLVPGLSLLVLVGGSGLAAAVLTFTRHRWGALLSAVAGVMIMGFEIVEVVVIGSPVGLARNLQIFYFTFGLCQVALAASVWVAEHGIRAQRVERSPAH